MTKNPTTKPKCLVVEDNYHWRSALAKLMLGMGCDVEMCENAHQAIRFVEDPEVRFDILLLDWDLRAAAGTLFPSKIGADVLDALPREKRPYLKVVIVTGALDDPEFQNNVDQDLNDIHEIIDGYQPFRKIRKKRYARELKSGLKSLRDHFEEIGLLERSSTESKGEFIKGKKKPEPPFRLDYISPRFLDAKSRTFALPVKCHNVLRALLMKRPSGGGNPAHSHGFLTDNEVSSFYKDKREDPPVSPYQFARALRKYMKDHYDWPQRDSLVKRHRNTGFAIGDDWHETRPLFDASEASLNRTVSIDDAERNMHRRPGAKKPSSE